MLTNSQNIILKDQLTQNDIDHLIKKWDLDPTIFTYPNSSIEVARFIPIDSNKLKNGHLLVSFDLLSNNLPIEQELIPIFTIFDQNHLFIGTTRSLSELKPQENIIETIFQSLCIQIKHLHTELVTIKQKIDHLDQAARRTTKTKELKKVTDLTRQLVYLKHTLDDQTPSLEEFGNYLVENKLANQARVKSIITRQKRITKMIHVYTDLLDSISGLFTAMMDSHLNHLMKYLDSAALVIALPALISGIWGMNVGGLPGKENENGFWILIIFVSLLTIGWGIFLKSKKYND